MYTFKVIKLGLMKMNVFLHFGIKRGQYEILYMHLKNHNNSPLKEYPISVCLNECESNTTMCSQFLYSLRINDLFLHGKIFFKIAWK